MIENKVKLVIWDLDDTFWRGTLTEEGITPIDSNIDLVRELSTRGIINSICSKNDYEQTKAKLTELGIWEYFVFPSISFNPKGKAIAEMIESAALRAENVLFIDDNALNLEEVKFFNPGIMTGLPVDLLDTLHDHPNLAGKPDPELTRLKQYQFLQRKVEERSTRSVSNDEFLRLSGIKVTIDHNVEAHFDRVVELINRTNQLNYTKKRLETRKSIDMLRERLGTFGHSAGCVYAVDKYGDYGLIGFFLVKKRANLNRLIHFVFSCRTMNMGIEQYVYELLGKPDIEIVGPVSCGLNPHATIDWINTDEPQDEVDSLDKGRKLLLLGGCDLLQLASYCSTNRLEFVNRFEGESKVRYDDPGFIIGDRSAIHKYRDLLQCWSYEDALKFDEGVATSELILLCMWAAMNGFYYGIDDAVRFRMEKSWAKRVREKDPDWFDKNLQEITLEDEERLRLVLECFDSIGEKSPASARIFVIGASTLAIKGEKGMARRLAFNEACRTYCEGRPKFCYIDVDAILPREALVDERHFSPAGYFALARYILDKVKTGAETAPTSEGRSLPNPVQPRGIAENMTA